MYVYKVNALSDTCFKCLLCVRFSLFRVFTNYTHAHTHSNTRPSDMRECFLKITHTHTHSGPHVFDSSCMRSSARSCARMRARGGELYVCERARVCVCVRILYACGLRVRTHTLTNSSLKRLRHCVSSCLRHTRTHARTDRSGAGARTRVVLQPTRRLITAIPIYP